MGASGTLPPTLRPALSCRGLELLSWLGERRGSGWLHRASELLATVYHFAEEGRGSRGHTLIRGVQFALCAWLGLVRGAPSSWRQTRRGATQHRHYSRALASSHSASQCRTASGPHLRQDMPGTLGRGIWQPKGGGSQLGRESIVVWSSSG